MVLLAAWPLTGAEPVALTLQAPGHPAHRTGNGASAGATFAELGRFVFFLSEASDLVAADRNGPVMDAFRRDLEQGSTALVSLTTAGKAGDRQVLEVHPASSGQLAVFVWASDDPGAGDTNRMEDVYLRDLLRSTTTLVSVNLAGTGAGNGASAEASVSRDGRFIVFESLATDLVNAPDTNATSDVFLRDIGTGTTILLSRTSTGHAGNQRSWAPEISHDGAVVVFRSLASDLGPVTRADTDLMVYRRASGTLERLTLPNGTDREAGVIYPAEELELGRDGRRLAFYILSQTRDPRPSNPRFGLWWRDLVLQEWVQVSADPLIWADPPALSGDGSVLAFTANVGAAPAVASQIRIWSAGPELRTLQELQEAGSAAVPDPRSSRSPVLSPDGRGLLFLSADAVPEAGVFLEGPDRLYHRNLATGATTLLAEGAAFSGRSFDDAGRRVVLDLESDVDPELDANAAMDVVTVSLEDGRREVVSRAQPRPEPRAAMGQSHAAGGSSDDGRWWGFFSNAPDLVAVDTNRAWDGFVSDRSTDRRIRLGDSPEGPALTAGVSGFQIARDGQRAVFTSGRGSMAAVHVQDLVTGDTILASAADGSDLSIGGRAWAPRLSGDGNRVLFRAEILSDALREVLLLRDVRRQRTWEIVPEAIRWGDSAMPPDLSVDGRSVLFRDYWTSTIIRASGGTWKVVLSLETRLSWLSPDGSAVVYHLNGPDPYAPTGLFWRSLNPLGEPRRMGPAMEWFGGVQISADGSILALVERQIVEGSDIPTTAQINVIVLATGERELVSITRDGQPGDGDSRDPQLSADGRWVAFRSAATRLVEGDDNDVPDVFVRDRHAGRTHLLSRDGQGRPLSGPSFGPRISADGRFVAFTTFARDLLPGDFNEAGDVVLVANLLEPAPDADRDGLPDGWERDYFGSLEVTADADADGDGFSNREEYRARTSPADLVSRLRITEAEALSDSIAIEWAGHVGVNYQVERRTGLDADAVWTPDGPSMAGYEGTLRQVIRAGAAEMFLRVVVQGE